MNSMSSRMTDRVFYSRLLEKSKKTLFLLMLVEPLSASADSFWLIGSYPDRTDAIAEAERISAAVGSEVYLQGGRSQYRVLIELMDNLDDQEMLRKRLQGAGVGELYVLDYGDNVPSLQLIYAVPEVEDGFSDMFVDMEAMTSEFTEDLDEQDLAEIDAMLASFTEDAEDAAPIYIEDGRELASYVCVASFLSEVKAESMVMDLNLKVTGYEVFVRQVTVKGADYFRVLVGAVAPSDEDSLMAQLTQMGHQDVWLVKASERRLPDDQAVFEDELVFEDEPVRVKKPPEKPQPAKTRSYPGEDSEYNPARLRRN